MNRKVYIYLIKSILVIKMSLPKEDILKIIRDKYPNVIVQGLFAEFTFDLGDNKFIVIEDQGYLKECSGLSYDPNLAKDKPYVIIYGLLKDAKIGNKTIGSMIEPEIEVRESNPIKALYNLLNQIKN